MVIWDEKMVLKCLANGEQCVRDYSNDFLSACEVEQIRVNPEWLKAGLFRWKPAIVCHMLDHHLSDGDVLVWLDCNLEKFPCYEEFIRKGPRFFASLIFASSVILFRESYRSLSRDTKLSVLQEYMAGWREYGRRLPSIWAGLIIFRKDFHGDAFAKKWLNICTVKNLAPLPDVHLSRRFSEYKWHSQEQSMLAVLYNIYLREIRTAPIRIFLSPSRRVMNWMSPRMVWKWMAIKYLAYLANWFDGFGKAYVLAWILRWIKC